MERAHLALYIFDLSGSGAQRRTVTLANAFAERGLRVDLVVVDRTGPLSAEVSQRVQIVSLCDWGAPAVSARLPRAGGQQLAVPALCRYIRNARPSVLLSAAIHVHLSALSAHFLAGSPCPLVLRLSNHLWRGRAIRRPVPFLARLFYPHADGFIAVSQSVADEMIELGGLKPRRIRTIHNPVVTPELFSRAEEPLDHPWFARGEPPVVLGVGRLEKQKDFPTLVRAFARVISVRPARLLILGDSKKPLPRRELEGLIAELGIEDSVRLEGFVANPLPFMKGAAVFALSSVWEGMPSALIESMACGCPVVSTDCPGGSREILQEGKLGPLVAVGDDAALAEAILSQLESPTEGALLERRAADFGLAPAVDRYLEMLLKKDWDPSWLTRLRWPHRVAHLGSRS